MTRPDLADCRILVVEDEYWIASELRMHLSKAGAQLVGPVGTLATALEMAECEPHIDAAILDINLHGEEVFALADLLASREVPFVFATGYDNCVVPQRFAGTGRYRKPVELDRIIAAVGQLVQT